MSDFDNIREDRYSDQLEREEKARQESIDYHAENWMTAVTKSVKESSGTFQNVKECTWHGFERVETIRVANSVDVFIEELHNKDFLERAAKILIDLQKFGHSSIDELLDDMAANYAEYQYENSIKE